MVEATLPLLGLSPVAGKDLVARFDGGRLSSDGGLLMLREVERRLVVADRLAACITDRRAPDHTVHTLVAIVRFRLLAIAAGYEDGNDATGLRGDPVFKLALHRLPSERDLCSQSTISRLENVPDVWMLLRMGQAMVDLYCASFRQVPKRIVLDIDDTFDPCTGSPCRRPHRESNIHDFVNGLLSGDLGGQFKRYTPFSAVRNSSLAAAAIDNQTRDRAHYPWQGHRGHVPWPPRSRLRHLPVRS